MGAELVVGAIGLIGAAVTFTCFSALYVIAQILMTGSVWFVGVNIILVIVNYDSWNQGSHSDYVNNLHIIGNDKRWFLWLALILAVVGTFLVLVCIVGFTKLFYTPKKKRTMDDDANYLGFPVWKTCIFLNIASCAVYMFVLFFLPVSLAMPMMAVELAVGIVGLLSSMSSYRFLTRIYLFVQSVMIIPVLCSCWNLIAIYNNFDYLYNVCWHNCDKYATHNEIRIMRIPWRILIAAMAFAGIGTALVVISLIGFRKLIRFQGKYVADIHTTQIFHSPPSKPIVVNHSMIPNSIGLNQVMQNSMTQTQMIPQPVYIVDPNKYNVVYQPYGIQQQVQGLPAQSPPMENLQVPPAYPVKGGKPNEEFPPGYQA